MSKIRVRVTRDYEVDPDGWAQEYDMSGGLTVHTDLENYLGGRGAGDADFNASAEADGIVVQTRHTVLVGDGPQLLFAPKGAEEYAVNRLRLALIEQSERRDPALLLLMILSDLGVRLAEA